MKKTHNTKTLFPLLSQEKERDLQSKCKVTINLQWFLSTPLFLKCLTSIGYRCISSQKFSWKNSQKTKLHPHCSAEEKREISKAKGIQPDFSVQHSFGSVSPVWGIMAYHLRNSHEKIQVAKTLSPLLCREKKERPPKQNGFNQISQYSTLLEVSRQYRV